MKALSLRLFADQELLMLLFWLVLTAVSLTVVYKKGLFNQLFNRKQNQRLSFKWKISDGYQKSQASVPWEGKDVFLVILITLLYSIVSLWQLGSAKLPETQWQPASEDEFLILEITGDSTAFDQLYLLPGEGDNNALEDGYQIGLKNIQITGSNDQNTWELIADIDESSYLQWKIIDGSWNYRYIGIIVKNSRDVINEIGFKRAGFDEFLPVRVKTRSNTENPYIPENIIDEQDKLPIRPTYMDETYFDEIYHVRNAQEISQGQFMYASVHPLLGTQIIAFFIKVLGNNPFAWRIGGALFGIAMLPVFYCLCKALFKKSYYAAAGTIFLACDFMHLTTSRIATLEPFSVFFIILMTYFMLRYVQLSFYDTDLKKTLKWLMLSGISMGFGIAVKWTGAYAGIGLAILFFSSLLRRGIEYRKAKKKVTPDNFEKHIIETFPKYAGYTLLWCGLWFVFIPLVIYFAAYIPCHIYRNEAWSIEGVIRQTIGMYKYHANLEATHPFQSVWWQWILDIRPIWYYHRVYDEVVYTISAFGNPLIWWSGLAAVLFCVIQVIKKKAAVSFWILVSYLAQLVPWMLVTRCVFIYHYYPSVPFLILALVYSIQHLIECNPRMQKRVTGFIIVCVILFLLFLPATAGFGTTKGYIDGFLRWFPSWYFG